MIRTQKKTLVRTQTLGDAAVDGLLAGEGAGLVMAAYLLLSGLVAGQGPAQTLARFDVAGNASPLAGLLLHLAISAAYGIAFGLLYRLTRRWRPAHLWAGVVMGLLYGLILLAVAQGVVPDVAAGGLRALGFVHLAVAHLLFGGVLGGILARHG